MDRKEYLRIGEEICKELVEKIPIETIRDSVEGRENAEKIEKGWIDRLKSITGFEFENKQVVFMFPPETSGNKRFWFDFAFVCDSEFFPINFKSGKGSTKDNISGLKYVRYLVFYDADASFNIASIKEETLSKRIVLLLNKEEEFNETNRDYFCLAHCQEDDSVRVVPVGCIHDEDLLTNPKNLFQTDFHSCRVVERDLKEMVSFIIKKFIEYQKKRAASYSVFEEAGFSEDSKIEL